MGRTGGAARGGVCLSFPMDGREVKRMATQPVLPYHNTGATCHTPWIKNAACCMPPHHDHDTGSSMHVFSDSLTLFPTPHTTTHSSQSSSSLAARMMKCCSLLMAVAMPLFAQGFMPAAPAGTFGLRARRGRGERGRGPCVHVCELVMLMWWEWGRACARLAPPFLCVTPSRRCL